MGFRKFLWVAAGLIAAAACSGGASVVSPEGNVSVEVVTDADGVPRLSVSAFREPVMDIYAGGLVTIADGRENVADGREAPTDGQVSGTEAENQQGLRVKRIKKSSADEVWTQPWGENKTLRDRHKEIALEMEGADGTEVTLRIRVFDDGLGFRYEYASETDSLTVLSENTRFCFAQDGTSWSIPGNFETYELDTRELPLSAVETANTPFTFHAGNVWGSIHEAALYDFPEMNLYAVRETEAAGAGTTGTEAVDGSGAIETAEAAAPELRTELAPLHPREGVQQGTKARIPGRFTTPWRTVQLSREAVGLINSSLILNLNEPCKIEDVSWIRPQKYVGVWWGMHLGTHSWTMGPRHGATTESALKYIDFAAENNIEGVLFEGWNEGWENWGGSQRFDWCAPYADFDLDRIVAYAAEKGVELWMHDETGGSIFEYEGAIDTTFAFYHSLGVRTLKTGYAGGMPRHILHHSQRSVQHYQKVVETAAKYQIMIDAHEPIKETGIRRTWPNMMTREGAKGMEWNAWSKGNNSEYLCTIPFTRLLSGPMDYTPGVFDIYYRTADLFPDREEWNGDNSQCYIKTTLARQIANWVLLYSPLQMACDMIENYEGHPAFQFFWDFDADCDWSEALAGYPGDYIVIARRAGERFFLGAGTDDSARTVPVALTFLEAGKTYKADVYADDPDAGLVSQPDGTTAPDKTAYRIFSLEVTAEDTLEVPMAAHGGYAVVFSPVEPG